MVHQPRRSLANNSPVPQTIACCMIIPDGAEFRNKIPPTVSFSVTASCQCSNFTENGAASEGVVRNSRPV
jgi:hypothetical protein